MDLASDGWETWSWDESLFAGAARYYEQGRLPYAPGLADAFAGNLALDGQGRLLDVGCGPGTVALRLAPLFEAVVGLDPDPDMLACASRAAAGQGIGNATWIRERAEALPAGLGSFRVVTFAQSFHWMDRPRVASSVATMLDPGGAVVLVGAPGYQVDELAAETRRGSLLFPPPPDDALDQLRLRYLGSDRRAGQGIRNTSPSGEDEVFQQAGFLPTETVTVPDNRAVEQTVDDVVARVFSTSSTAPHLFGDRQQDYERDLREVLAQASPSGRFSVRLPDNILRIWRLPVLPARLATVLRCGRRAGLARPGRARSTVGRTMTRVKTGRAVLRVTGAREWPGRARGCGSTALPAVVTAAAPACSSRLLPQPWPAPPPGHPRKPAPAQRPGTSRLPQPSLPVSPWSWSARRWTAPVSARGTRLPRTTTHPRVTS